MATDAEKSLHSTTMDTKHGHGPNGAQDDSFIETLEHAAPGYANDRASDVAKELVEDEDSNPNIHHHVRIARCA